MIPGEYQLKDGDIALCEGRDRVTLEVANRGDRPIQVGSHYHFAETNPALAFDRVRARGFRLDVAAGSAVTSDVADGDLRMVRGEQIVKPGWADRFHDAMRKKKAAKKD